MNRRQLARGTHVAARAWHRANRIVADTPRARLAAELRFRADREALRGSIAGPFQDDDLLSELRARGMVSTTVSHLDLDRAVKAADPLAEELLASTPLAAVPTTHLRPDRLASAPDVFQWGAEDRILDLIERYLEVPVAYHGVYVRRDLAVDRSGASNLWHLDMEDRRVIKVIVYLTDVDEGDGAFQYIPLDHSLELRRQLGMTYRLGDDADMRRLVPDSEWRTADGPAGTVLIADTATLFHKGSRPRTRDRVALFYDYTSRRPVHPYYCKSALPRLHLEQLTEGMGSRTRDAVFWRRRLTEFDPLRHE